MEQTSKGQPIASVEIRADSVIEKIPSSSLKQRLKGCSFGDIRRHGKYLLAQAAGGDEASGWLVLHFGMTGFPEYFRKQEPHPEHHRLVLCFENGGGLGYSCRRKLGSVGWCDSPEELAEEKDLGPDALALERQDFVELLGAARGGLISLLMNQSRIAGIGNVYSDEILYQAGLHPHTPVKGVDEREAEALHRTLERTLRTAIERDADVEQYPSAWLTRRRDEEARCGRCDGKIEKVKAAGRTAYFCPKHQAE